MIPFSDLKAKQRAIRSGFSPELGLRVHRCLSWLERAEMADGDNDAKFIFLWISFNAAYAKEMPLDGSFSEKSTTESFFRAITGLDNDHRIYDAIWDRFPQSIRMFINNPYVFYPFWRYQNQLPGSENWSDEFERAKRRFNRALSDRDTRVVLSMLFERLYVLRNQLVHGGATWQSSINRDQVRDGASILACLAPLFADIMMENADVDWGPPYYPVVE
tara:strand:+ start:1423 stop:2076 length:654 start_codon:yes stop_codon:yes gene_type:complete